MATANVILNATIDLLREVGYNGTSLKRIVETSGTTTGSVYHFFPAGKDQLTVEAIRYSGPLYQQIIEHILDEADNLPEGIYQVFEQAGQVLVDTNYLDPCPIGGIAREVASVKPELREAAAEVFASWSQALAMRLREAGVDAAQADDMSATAIAAIEGGFVLTRTHRDPEPLRKIGRTLQRLFASVLRDAG